MTAPIQRRSNPYRPWLLAAGFIVAGFAILFAIKPPKKSPPPDEVPFVQASDAPGPAPEGMVWIPGGPFWMGSDESPDGDAPVHQVAVSGFWMDKTEVTNAQFDAFVKATGYKTIAEREPTAEDFNGKEVPMELRQAFSICFQPVHGDVPLYGLWETGSPPGGPPSQVNWRHPEGPQRISRIG
jgi:formylglycine-generating enzyme required for sulfatase activity